MESQLPKFVLYSCYLSRVLCMLLWTPGVYHALTTTVSNLSLGQQDYWQTTPRIPLVVQPAARPKLGRPLKRPLQEGQAGPQQEEQQAGPPQQADEHASWPRPPFRVGSPGRASLGDGAGFGGGRAHVLHHVLPVCLLCLCNWLLLCTVQTLCNV